MSRKYQALQKSRGLTAFDPDSSTNGMLDTGRGLPDIPAKPLRDIPQAVADLIHNKLLTHSFGVQGEGEIRTMLIANNQVWRYRSRVFVHGKEASKGFPSIDGERTRHIRQAEVERRHARGICQRSGGGSLRQMYERRGIYPDGVGPVTTSAVACANENDSVGPRWGHRTRDSLLVVEGLREPQPRTTTFEPT
jgi:hypothetical protein